MLDRPADVVSQHFGHGNTLTVSVCSSCRNGVALTKHPCTSQLDFVLMLLYPPNPPHINVGLFRLPPLRKGRAGVG